MASLLKHPYLTSLCDVDKEKLSLTQSAVGGMAFLMLGGVAFLMLSTETSPISGPSPKAH